MLSALHLVQLKKYTKKNVSLHATFYQIVLAAVDCTVALAMVVGSVDVDNVTATKNNKNFSTTLVQYKHFKKVNKITDCDACC